MRVFDVLTRGGVRTVFQPISNLDTGAVVAYEALTRGPAGPLERPAELFRAARDEGLLVELDAMCRRLAIHTAARVGITAPQALFVKIEPDLLDAEAFAGPLGAEPGEPGTPRLVLEISQRAITARPTELLAGVDRLRQAGWRIALDGVGGDNTSLTFMPRLRPDVVKVDLALMQRQLAPVATRITAAVRGYVHEYGAAIVAEGIESARHLDQARLLGAQFGQGFLLGRPTAQIDADAARGRLDFRGDRTRAAAPTTTVS